VAHDCDSEFLQSCRLIDFQAEITNFVSGGSSETTLAKSKAKNKRKSGQSTASSGKLVDITQLRAKFIVKIDSVIQMARVQLAECQTLFIKYEQDEEPELLEKFRSFVTKGATQSDILQWEGVEDEGGMMKCLFTVDTRFQACRVLAAPSLEELRKCLGQAGQHICEVDSDKRE
ncbi:unnamed protein product, partial [Durusdinium trenchii]